MKFVSFFAILVAFIGVTSACRCIPPREPRHCRTQFLMFVKITAETINVNSKSYSFELIRDISYPHQFLTTFTAIVTGLNSADCAVTLEVGKYYLLGGSADEPNGLLNVRTCGGYVREWENCPCSQDTYDELSVIYKKCYDFHNTMVAQTAIFDQLPMEP